METAKALPHVRSSETTSGVPRADGQVGDGDLCHASVGDLDRSAEATPVSETGLSVGQWNHIFHV